eukprot:810628-Rhodomonas_salina.1
MQAGGNRVLTFAALCTMYMVHAAERGAGGELVVGDAKLDKETRAVVLSCEGDTAQFVVGAEVEQCVDAAVRIRNTRLHSVGHLLDVAVKAVCGKAWQPGKGYHFENFSSSFSSTSFLGLHAPSLPPLPYSP